MKCRQAKELMGAYLYGDLAPEEMRELRVHTQDCTLCREDLATRGRVVSSLSDIAPALSDTDRQRIEWSVKGAVGRKKVRTRPIIYRLAPTIGLAAAILAAGFAAGRLATRSPQHVAQAPKAPHTPRAKIEIKETTPNTAKTSKVPDQMISALRLIFQATQSPEVNRQAEPGSRHLPGRTSPTQPEIGVKVAPEPKAPVVQQQPSEPTVPVVTIPKESEPGAKKTEGETNAGATKLPKVTDPKNAETAPSEAQ